MKLAFILAAGLFLSGCNDKEDNDKKDDMDQKTAQAEIKLPLEVSYKAVPAVGSWDNAAMVMNFNTAFIDGDMAKMGSMLADSVTFTLADGTMFNGTKDAAIAMVTNWRNSMSSAKQTYIAIVPLDNTTNGDQWVFQWLDEEHNYKDGKKEHNILHEDYRLVNGKVRQINQYAQAVPEKK
jgi:hypothetical protein